MIATTKTAILAIIALASTSAAPVPSGSWPAYQGTPVRNNKPITVKAGTVFDGKMQVYERSDITCTGDNETGPENAVFLVEPGATLKNVVIGKNQAEGVHCENHGCKLENVWWDDVCEDALTIKGGSASSVATITGGGARSGNDKLIQHNGAGHVIIDGFYAQNFGKVYRSCGNCKTQVARKVTISNVLAVNPTAGIATVNKNFGDQATFSNIYIKSSKSSVKVCTWSQGTTDGSEPVMLGDGPLPPLCNYATSDIHLTKI